MRSLFICPWVPYPLDTGGNQRRFHLLRAVASVSRVTFISPAPHEDADANPLRDICEKVLFFPRDAFWWREEPGFIASRWTKAMIRRCATFEPLLLHNYFSSTAKRLITDCCADPFDLVWVERLFCLHWLPDHPLGRVVIDLDDLEHRKLSREIAVSKPSMKMALDYLEYVKLRHFELNLPKKNYELVVSSNLDKRVLGNKDNVWVVPNGVAIPQTIPEPSAAAGGPVILFVGLMNYEPNVDAVCFFAREVLPLIHRDYPTAKFLIVGRSPSPAVLKLHDGAKIVVTGTVAEVEPYLREAAVVVAPLRVGGGTRIKILEAMAHQRAVVATTIGAEGLEVESGKHLLIADSCPAFADACVRLLRDANMRREMSISASSLVRKKYDWLEIERSVGRTILGEPAIEDVAAVQSGPNQLLNEERLRAAQYLIDSSNGF